MPRPWEQNPDIKLYYAGREYLDRRQLIGTVARPFIAVRLPHEADRALLSHIVKVPPTFLE